MAGAIQRRWIAPKRRQRGNRHSRFSPNSDLNIVVCELCVVFERACSLSLTQLRNFPFDASDTAFAILFDVMLPYTHNRPAIAPQSCDVSSIAGNVSANLVKPIGRQLFRPLIKLPAMPEIAINKHRELNSGEDNVWFAR